MLPLLQRVLDVAVHGHEHGSQAQGRDRGFLAGPPAQGQVMQLCKNTRVPQMFALPAGCGNLFYNLVQCKLLLSTHAVRAGV